MLVKKILAGWSLRPPSRRPRGRAAANVQGAPHRSLPHMPNRPVSPRAAALANLFFPGTGYLLLTRRVLLGGLLTGYTMITVALAGLYLATLYAHYDHVGPDGMPGIAGTIVLFTFQHAAVAVGTALDAREQALEALAPAARG